MGNWSKNSYSSAECGHLMYGFHLVWIFKMYLHVCNQNIHNTPTYLLLLKHFFIPYDANIILLYILYQSWILGPYSEYALLLPCLKMCHKGNHHRKTLSEARKLFCVVNFKKLGCPMRSLSKLSNSKVCRPPGFLNF